MQREARHWHRATALANVAAMAECCSTSGQPLRSVKVQQDATSVRAGLRVRAWYPECIQDMFFVSTRVAERRSDVRFDGAFDQRKSIT